MSAPQGPSLEQPYYSPVHGRARQRDSDCGILLPHMPSFSLLLAAVLLAFPASVPQAKKQRAPAAKAQPSPEDRFMAEAARTADATINWNKSSTPGMHVTVQLLKKAEID